MPYDIFNDIIKFSDMHTLWQLYNTDKIIRQLCLNDPFCKILVSFNTNPYFNLNATSAILNDFLNDLVGNELETLKLSFGELLIKNRGKIIMLTGSSNGKSTFLYLIKILLNNIFKNGCLSLPITYYKSGYILSISETTYEINNTCEKLKLLSKGFNIIYTNNDITDVIDISTTLKADLLDKNLSICGFKTKYLNMPYQANHKVRVPQMIDLLTNKNVLSALLNFLLEGCRQCL